jgi:hypothetical protein
MRFSGLHSVVPGLLAGCLLAATSANAATINFTGAGGNGGGYGNNVSFSGGGIGVTATAYAETGSESPVSSGWYLFQTAEVYSWSTGIGICNRNEGVAGSGCSDIEHEVDTVSRDDLLVLVFDQRVSFLNLTVDPYDTSGSDPNDRDVIYWVGDTVSLPSLLTYTFNTLASLPGFAPEVLSSASSSYSPYTHSLTGTGNILIMSGDYHNRACKNADVTQNSECEAYKIKNINVIAAPAVVPVPAAVWMFGSALALLGVARRRIAK